MDPRGEFAGRTDGLVACRRRRADDQLVPPFSRSPAESNAMLAAEASVRATAAPLGEMRARSRRPGAAASQSSGSQPMARVSAAETPRLPEVADHMARWSRTKGYPPNAWQTMLRLPKVFLAYRDLHSAVMMDQGEVPRALKFMVAEVVSSAAGCTYCTAHNAENAVRIAGVAPEKVEALCNFRDSPLFAPAEKAALALAQAAGGHPPSVDDEHFSELKTHFSEDGVVEIVAVIALLGWLNRWNQTLGTKLEPAAIDFAERHLAPGGWQAGIAAPAE
jgi:uncharacterized peroxidase-related enzyme